MSVKQASILLERSGDSIEAGADGVGESFRPEMSCGTLDDITTVS